MPVLLFRLNDRVMRHRQLQEPEVLAADDADARRRDEMSDEEEEEELDEEVSIIYLLKLLRITFIFLFYVKYHADQNFVLELES